MQTVAACSRLKFCSMKLSGIFSQIFSIHGQLYPQMQYSQTQRSNNIRKEWKKVNLPLKKVIFRNFKSSAEVGNHKFLSTNEITRFPSALARKGRRVFGLILTWRGTKSIINLSCEIESFS